MSMFLSHTTFHPAIWNDFTCECNRIGSAHAENQHRVLQSLAGPGLSSLFLADVQPLKG